MVNKRIAVLLFLVGISLPASLSADPGSSRSGMLDIDFPLTRYIGYTLEQSFSSFGVPAEVFSFRGPEAWQDNVVFFYGNDLYLFWYKNRVWQVRVDGRSGASFMGLSMGDSRGKILSVLGKPFYQNQDSLIYILPDRGYPVRLRLFFDRDILSDLYIYRGDF